MTRQDRNHSPNDPPASARAARLRYVTDQSAGLRRRRQGRGFRYVDARGRAVGPKHRERIRRLAIPPAWEGVWICPHPNGHLQATGIDARGRKQYLYHSDWRTVRDETKFHHLIAFARVLPGIRRRVARDLRLRGLSRTKVLAAVVRLLEETCIRVGNPEYARDNESFGLSTLRNRHVEVRGKELRFQFRGKSGKMHRVTLADQRLARIVKNCQELPGYELFQYIDDDEKIRVVTSGDVNDYLRGISGQDFTAKDFRTWAGTVHAAKILAELDRDNNSQQTKEILLQAIDQVAKKLGNTRAVCRKAYIHPAIVAAYNEGTLARRLNDRPRRPSRTGLRSEEKAVVSLLKPARWQG
ncbi:MAG TPA: DNA topoisomerase IB [Verrucomicrobiae bacterium]|nr:DNA topoisomerase IB [Verrucomicrobiae bacterium]